MRTYLTGKGEPSEYLTSTNAQTLIDLNPDPSKLRAWAKSLREGGFTQISGHLRNYDQCRCVLGVAVDAINPALWDCDEPNEALSIDFSDLVPLIGSAAPSSNALYFLIHANDFEHVPFTQFADFFEEVADQCTPH